MAGGLGSFWSDEVAKIMLQSSGKRPANAPGPSCDPGLSEFRQASLVYRYFLAQRTTNIFLTGSVSRMGILHSIVIILSLELLLEKIYFENLKIP